MVSTGAAVEVVVVMATVAVVVEAGCGVVLVVVEVVVVMISRALEVGGGDVGSLKCWLYIMTPSSQVGL